MYTDQKETFLQKFATLNLAPGDKVCVRNLTWRVQIRQNLVGMLLVPKGDCLLDGGGQRFCRAIRFCPLAD